MSLSQKIEADLKAAMLAREALKLETLRALKSAVKYIAIEKGGASYEVTDADVMAAVRKELKKRQDAVESYEKANRPELAQKEKDEAVILNGYLPAAMSPEQAEGLVKEVIAQMGATSKKQMGEVMKAAQAKAAGAVDGKTLSQLVSKLLLA